MVLNSCSVLILASILEKVDTLVLRFSLQRFKLASFHVSRRVHVVLFHSSTQPSCRAERVGEM